MDDDQKPKTLDELEKELDKDELKPEDVEVDGESDDDVPNPRAPGTQADTAPELSDEELRRAAEATEDANDDEAVPSDQSLHVEKRQEDRTPFWKRKKFWFITIVTLIIGLSLAWLIRPSRLAIVDILGLRTTVTVTTSAPAGNKQALVKNVEVMFNTLPVPTNDKGIASASVPYGELQIEAKKQGYATASHTVLLDFDPFFYLLGGRPADEKARAVALKMEAVGTLLKFEAIDWLTDKPMTAGTFSLGDIIVKPDEKGLVSILVPATEAKEVKIKASFDGAYVAKDFKLSLTEKGTKKITFVPAGRTYFVSNRSGAPAILASNIDGSQVKEVIKGGAGETAAMNFAVNPSGKFGVLTSTRDGKRDDQGTLLQQLYVVDLATKNLKQLDEGQWFTFVDWSGDTLVYTVGERLPKASETTQRLASVDVTGTSRKNLSTASYFGAVRVALGNVMYVAGEADSDTSPELRALPVKGGIEKTLGNNVQQLAQPDVDRFTYQTGDGVWHDYNVNTAKVSNASAPSSLNRAFVANASADGQHRLALDKIDGQPTLIVKNIANGKERKLFSAAGLQGPIRWVGNAVVFRVIDNDQTADYALPVSGGEPKKITDVTHPASATPPLANYLTFF